MLYEAMLQSYDLFVVILERDACFHVLVSPVAERFILQKSIHRANAAYEQITLRGTVNKYSKLR